MKTSLVDRRLTVKAIAILIMIVGGFNLLNCMAYGLTPPIAHCHIESDFVLWKPSEKMINTNFTIHLYYINNETNNTNNYTIQINDIIRESQFSFYANESFDFPDNTYISVFKVIIGNQTLLDEKDIQVMGSVSSVSVRRGLSGDLISLNPLEWGAKERNVASGVTISAILSIFISYTYLKYWRTKYGLRIKGGN